MDILTLSKNLLVNIAYLALIAEVFSRIGKVQDSMLKRRKSWKDTIFLSVLFSLVIIFSTYTGIHIENYSLNTRMIGAMSAGLLCGPLVGFFASLLGALYVFFCSTPVLFAHSSAFSTLLFGLLGAGFYPYFQRGKWDYDSLFIFACFAEVVDMCCLIRLNVSLQIVLNTIVDAALPMIVLNAVGLLIFISCFNNVFIKQDVEISKQLQKMTRLTRTCLPLLQSPDREKLDQMTIDVMNEMSWPGVLLLNPSGSWVEHYGNVDDVDIYSEELYCLAKKAVQDNKFRMIDEIEAPALVENDKKRILNEYVLAASPFRVKNESVGALAILIKKQWYGNQSDIELLKNFVSLGSLQLSMSELERQTSLRQEAEIKALQFQINPHFLFNALNTISYICREDGEQARMLLITLADYFRYNLKSDVFMVPLEEELDHVRDYLELEFARFEDKLIVTYDIPEDLSIMVPVLILQPIVENAIRHGVGPKSVRDVHIEIKNTDEECIVKVSDKGKGFDPEVIQKLYNGEDIGKSIGLSNVHKRLKSIYGEDHGLIIRSDENGSTVEMHFTNMEGTNENSSH